MKFEQDLMPSAEVVPWSKPSADAARKAVRMATDNILHDALKQNSLPALADSTATAMLAVAGTLSAMGMRPELEHFVEAACALLEESRSVIDGGLMLNRPDSTMLGAVMIEITCRGVCAALSIPYEDVVREVHAASQEARDPSIDDILIRAGLMAPKENAA